MPAGVARTLPDVDVIIMKWLFGSALM